MKKGSEGFDVIKTKAMDNFDPHCTGRIFARKAYCPALLNLLIGGTLFGGNFL